MGGSPGVLKFNVDGTTRGKLGPTGIGGALSKDQWEIIFMFSKGVGVKNSYEVTVLAILVTLRIFFSLIPGQFDSKE